MSFLGNFAGMERPVRVTVFLICLLPLVVLGYRAFTGGLGPDPAEQIMHVTGNWGARCLILCLLVAPLRPLVREGWFIKLRRPLGLYAFFYGSLHLVAFSHFFLGWGLPLFWEELADRPYITAGFLAWLAMLPLAITSTRNMQRRLRKNWRRLHKLIFFAALLISAHVLWQARSDYGEALFYILVFAGLGLWRLKPLWAAHGAAKTG